jgi:hypothetical protein
MFPLEDFNLRLNIIISSLNALNQRKRQFV